MIKEFIDRFMAFKSELEAKYKKNHPNSYSSIVEDVVRLLNDDDEYSSPDPERITCIDHGDYQGTLLYIIGASGYQPSTYWAIYVSYGSCSACDTFQAIRYSDYTSDEPTDQQVSDYMTMALHMVQRMKEI